MRAAPRVAASALVSRWLAAACLLIVVLSGAGCGTPYATVPDRLGQPVMLLGHDPVAYFQQGEPVRGDPRWRVALPAQSPERVYYFASEENRRRFEADPSRYEPQYGGFCASGAAFAIKLGSDPTSWLIRDGRLFIFGDVLGKTAWLLDPQWNIEHADRLWPTIRGEGWRIQSLRAYADKVPWYLSGEQIRRQFEARHPGQAWPRYDPGGMATNLFLKPPGWRAAEGFGQPALGYPD